MTRPRDAKTLGEILGLDKGDSAEARAFRLYLDLDVRTQQELRALPAHHQNHWLAWGYYHEVMNGGIDQFFTNSSGDYALETLRAFEQIGLPVAVEALRKAIALFPGGQPASEPEARCQQVKELARRSPDPQDMHPIERIVGVGVESDDVFFELLMRYQQEHAQA